MERFQTLGLLLAGVVLAIVLCYLVAFTGDNPRTANREAVMRDLTNLAIRAQDYYRRPMALGGGQGSFAAMTADATGLAKLTSKPINANGTYSIAVSGTATEMVLKGIGTEKGLDGISLVDINMHVLADSMWADMIN